MIRLWVLGALVLALPACARWIAPVYDEVIPTRVDLDIYPKLYPDAVGICAVSQFRRQDGPDGGIPGHAVMFLQGACVDPDAPYPQLRLCREEGLGGAGVSVNRFLRNVNWIATPGISLFAHGDLKRHELLTEERVHATARRAIELGMFRGVELHPDLSGKPFDLERFVLEESLGTDFALRFGRSMFCAFMPLRRDMLERVVDYLNELNRSYAEGTVEYRWSGYNDNCVHTLHNALAAAGVWEPMSIQTVRLRSLFTFAVPANAFVDMGWLGSHFPLQSFSAVRGESGMRKSLLEQKWLPTRHGVIVQSAPVHQRNDVYDTRFRLFILQNPLRPGGSRKADRLLNDARTTEVDVNLYHWRARYQHILSNRPERDRFAFRSRTYLDEEQKFYDYIQTQLADVEQLIDRYLELIDSRWVRDPAESARTPGRGRALRVASPSR